MTAGDDMWVFGYGSLMWRPGFPHIEVRPALLRGYHRALCVHSTHYRGTEERPGLVVGLDRGGSCRGRAFRVAAAEAEAVSAYLWEREMNTDSYVRKWLPVAVGAARATACVFVVNRANPDQYAGKLTPDEIAERIVRGHGAEGSALEYLANTIAHLDEMGIRDGPLHRILQMAREKAGRPG